MWFPTSFLSPIGKNGTTRHYCRFVLLIRARALVSKLIVAVVPIVVGALALTIITVADIAGDDILAGFYAILRQLSPTQYFACGFFLSDGHFLGEGGARRTTTQITIILIKDSPSITIFQFFLIIKMI
jgi:hypothetical protein